MLKRIHRLFDWPNRRKRRLLIKQQLESMEIAGWYLYTSKAYNDGSENLLPVAKEAWARKYSVLLTTLKDEM